MNIMRALVIVGAGMVATVAAQAASTGPSINENQPKVRCKTMNVCVSPISQLAQH